ncbi:hypothetical protein [Streptomyces palmae]|uniref:Ku domain-containing protein n=1 Tax=Streptomyces palmae TaxID=1701085 RepID=A0A4Z0HH33_9ACTN|nr:hypothetical protein [Streptomyces palmae]TGB15615.1 hypothetical protein E4099_06560 [Streptomyces palmae]
MDDTIVLQSMHWPDEVRSAEGLGPKASVEISDAEVDEALALMEPTGGMDLSSERDSYRDALEEVIRAKAEGREPPEAEAEEAPAGKVVDLMSALKDSVRAARESCGEEADGGPAEVHEMASRGGKSATPKKVSAKKTTRKRAS